MRRRGSRRRRRGGCDTNRRQRQRPHNLPRRLRRCLRRHRWLVRDAKALRYRAHGSHTRIETPAMGSYQPRLRLALLELPGEDAREPFVSSEIRRLVTPSQEDAILEYLRFIPSNGTLSFILRRELRAEGHHALAQAGSVFRVPTEPSPRRGITKHGTYRANSGGTCPAFPVLNQRKQHPLKIICSK